MALGILTLLLCDGDGSYLVAAFKLPGCGGEMCNFGLRHYHVADALSWMEAIICDLSSRDSTFKVTLLKCNILPLIFLAVNIIFLIKYPL